MFNDIINGWTSFNPSTSNTVALRNLSPLAEQKIFPIYDYLSMEEKEALFVNEEMAKLLLTRQTISNEDPEHDKKVKEINDAVDENKTEGRLINIRYREYGEEKTWVIPGNLATFTTLTRAFDMAASAQIHVTVHIKPYDFETSATTVVRRETSKAAGVTP